MEVASKSFNAVILETYEQDWQEETKLRETLQALELMWADYLQHLQDSVQNPLLTYTSHFTPLKVRIAKRHRKQVYFDNARHNAEVLQNAKKKDEAKISKANEELEESKKIYEVLSNELHNELPEFFNSRITFYATTFKNYFDAESTFHGETGKLNDTAVSITDTLAEDNKQYTYQPRPLSGVMNNEETIVNGNSSGENDSKHSTPPSSKKGSKSPRPERPPTSPAAATATQDSPSFPTPIKTDGEGLTNGLPSDPESPPESPLYENNDVSYTTPSKVVNVSTENESESNITEQQVELPVSKYDEPVVNAERPVLNGPDGDKLQEEIKVISKPEPEDEVDDIPSHPPPQPPSRPPIPTKEPSPEEEDIPVKAVEIKDNVVEDDDSDHYYDKVPDQFDVKDDKNNENEEDDLYEIPTSSKLPDKLPDGCRFAVLATHLYKNEDEDELSFEAGELIYVMPFDDPDDQDDGWLLGVKKSDGKKGVFPENFTKRI